MVLFLWPGNYICSMYLLFLYLICMFYCLFDMESFPSAFQLDSLSSLVLNGKAYFVLRYVCFLISLLLIYFRLIIFFVFSSGQASFSYVRRAVSSAASLVSSIWRDFFSMLNGALSSSKFLDLFKNGYPPLLLLSLQSPKNRNSFYIGAKFIFINICFLVKLVLFLLSRLIFYLIFFS